ncbi:hypothetical protein DH09_02315 [Bacillaceae bacterium JMAK1]|nr:hypothetical protein DH09_02315 [Bacillaceae bacterium JMAK1]
MKKHIRYSVVAIAALFVVQGCSTDEEALERDAETEHTEERVVEEQDEETAEGLTERELYLIDSDGYVVPRTFSLPHDEEVLRQALEYMIDGGPITEMLPSGFQAVFPSDTEVLGVNVTNDGTAVVDFSEDFRDYDQNKEEAILQALTWTLTQYETIERVEILINGHEQDVMPHNETPITSLTRDRGINKEPNVNSVDVTATLPSTLYFLNENEHDLYYVPVTRRIDQTDNRVETVVNEVIHGPALQSELLTGLRHGVELVDEPTLNDGVLTVNFNEALLTENEGTAIATEALTMLTKTLTAIDGVDSVTYLVNGSDEINARSGDALPTAVTEDHIKELVSQ